MTKTKRRKKTRTSRGLGDTVEKALKAPGINKVTEAVKKVIWKDNEDCGCKKRKEKLNQLFAYKFKPVRCFTEVEYNEWGKFMKERTLRIEHDTIVSICKLFASIFNRLYYEPCRNCSPKPLMNMIERLDAIYNSYESDKGTDK